VDPLELLHQQPGCRWRQTRGSRWQVHSAWGMVQHIPAHGARCVLDGNECWTKWWHCVGHSHDLRGSTALLRVWWCQDSWMSAVACSLEIPHLDHRHTMWHCFCLLWHACYVTAFQVLMCHARSYVITCSWPYQLGMLSPYSLLVTCLKNQQG
jgi:hypothetical protein